MTRVAAVDCGTNSIRLLIADVDDDGTLHDLVRTMDVVRLGYGVDRTGMIDPQAMARTLRRTQEYARAAGDYGCEAVRFVATSASRDARNAADFVAGVEAAFAPFTVRPEVISGEEEASLSFLGATGDVIAAGMPRPFLVVDIGGGSTELVRGSLAVDASISVDIGSVRITERYFADDPPTSEQIARASQDIDAALDHALSVVDPEGIGTVVGLAGSITTVTAHVLGLPEYRPREIHLARLQSSAIHAAAADLLGRSREERSALGFMHPGRVDVIGAGALIWDRVIARLSQRSPDAVIVACEHDILDGIALSAATRLRSALS